MKYSLVTTERNEAADIAVFIESALNQSLKPDEIIIADGGSTDGTVEIINRYIKEGAPITLVHAPGNRSVGRNAATAAAKNEHIVVTDVGSRLDEDWLKNITQPFRDNPKAMAVAGNFKAEPETFFEKVSATLMLAPNDKIDLATWLPSSRSIAYTKTAWDKAGRYPEHTNFNEDTPFDLALKAAGYKFEDGLKAIVYWRPRPNLKEFYRQYYYYAIGDGLDSINLPHIVKLTVKYALFLLAIPLSLYILPILVFVPLGYFGLGIYRRIVKPAKQMRSLKATSLMIILVVVYDISQLFGYWKGYLGKSKLSGSKKLVR